MQYRSLGQSGLTVSEICLGTMTFGEQNTEAEGHAQLDYAIDHGVNYLDMAEMYPISPRKETQGRTEEIIGSWLAARGNRDKVVIATKLVSNGFPYIRGDAPAFDAADVKRGVEGSLRRIGIDYIDVYYLHWPVRQTNYFGQLDYVHSNDESWVPIQETLEALAEEVKAGRIRHVAISNETPWGMMQFLRLAEKYDLPRVVTIQNPYSLLNRSFEVGLAEMAIRENVGLSAYSPLGCGVLTGKYLGGKMPEGSRLALWPGRYTRYTKPNGIKATEAYVDLAREHGLNPAQMALAYVNTRPFVTSNIIGATTMEQLATNIGSVDVVLTDEVLAGIDAIHKQYSNPSP